MVSIMSTLVVKNLPDQLHEKLKKQAVRNHRSVTKEVVSLIEASVAEQGPQANPAQPVKVKVGAELGIEDIKAAIVDGRFAHYRSLDEVNEWVDELRQDRDVAP